jgi:hypothetical protein
MTEEEKQKDEEDRIADIKSHWWETIPKLGITTVIVVTVALFPAWLILLNVFFTFESKEILQLITVWFDAIKTALGLVITVALGKSMGEQKTCKQ